MPDQIIIVYLGGTLVFILFCLVLFLFLIGQRRKEENFRLRDEALEKQHRNELLDNRLHVQEESLNLISRELHDNINQGLGNVKISLARLRTSLRESETALIDACIQQLTETSADVRNISHSLNTELIKKIGLYEAIKKQSEIITSDKLRCSVSRQGEHDFLSPEQELIIFRIAQEALKNVLTHSRATIVDIKIGYTPSHFHLSIVDNGIGFDIEKGKDFYGIGLVNMHERARLLEGKLTISSFPGEGTKMEFILNA
jgi:two-component system, NarL family, sensor kinase